MPFYSNFPSFERSRLPFDQNPPTSAPRNEFTQDGFSPNQVSLMTDSELLGPALDGPPSPERLRQLSKQMRRASRLRRQPYHHHAISSSSSLASMNDSRSTWERDLDDMTRGLNRRSSNGSMQSSAASKEHTDNVHMFSKALFHRRGRSKYGNGSQSSSNSSLYSADSPADSSWLGSKESFIPSLFSRRKPSRDEPAIQQRPHISEPFNFQHVAHENRDTVLPNESMGDHIGGRVFGPSVAAVDTLKMRSLGSGLSTESISSAATGFVSAAAPRPTLMTRHTSSINGLRGLLKPARSQDHLRVLPSGPPPPRPPRSPLEGSFAPLPPPRSSSRQSAHNDEHISSHQTTSELEIGSFIFPQPASPPVVNQAVSTSPVTPLRPMDSPAARILQAGYTDNSPQILFSSSEATWPLGSPTPAICKKPLPDVPEEDERPSSSSRPSRISLTSNNSSLRGSQSVPMLRVLAESQRPTSGASETLGSQGATTQQEGLDGLDTDGQTLVAGSRESWEDDIDYCYEHEVEANCDYQWERPSMDVSRRYRGGGTLAAVQDDELSEIRTTIPVDQVQPETVPEKTAELDNSVTQNSEATSGTLQEPSVKDEGSPRQLECSGSNGLNVVLANNDPLLSVAEQVKDLRISHSLLIPEERYKELLHQSPEKWVERNSHGGLLSPDHSPNPSERDSHHLNPLSMWSPLQRSSTSTTQTDSSTDQSNYASERHKSTTSSWTASTRLTANSTELNKLGWLEHDVTPPVPLTPAADDFNVGAEAGHLYPVQQDILSELNSSAVLTKKKSQHRSHASESVVRSEVPMRSAMHPRRQRARTSSLGTQAPPVGQYSSFHKGAIVGGHGDRI